MPKPILKLLNALFWIFFLSPLIGYCQISVPQWVDDIGGPGSSSITSQVKADKQNNIYITGIFQGTVDFDPSAGVYNLTSNAGSFDTFLAKYTTNGKLIWAVAFGGDGTDQVNDMTLDAGGNPTVIGQFNSTVMDADPGPRISNLSNNGDWDAFVVKFDTNGKFVWGKSIGGPQTDYGDRVSVDASGNVIAAFKYEALISVGGYNFTSQGAFNGLVVKYDASGNVQWAINMADNIDCEARAVAVDGNGNILVCGNFTGNDNFNPLGTPYNMNGNGGSLFIAKYSASGILLWATLVAGNAVNSNIYLCVNSNNDVFLDGPFSSSLGFNSNAITLNPIGLQDVFLAKYNSDGIYQWSEDIGGAGASAYNYGIVCSADNYVYVSGYFSGTVDFDPSVTATALVSDHGQRDLFFAKYDSNGNYKWAFSTGNSGCNNTLGRNLAVDGNNDILLTGSFCSTVNFDGSKCTSYNLTAQSNIRDSFLGKYVQSSPTASSQITAFSVPQQTSPAVIDQTNQEITITVPAGTDITNLVPSITVSSGVTLSPSSGTPQNFSSPVTYTLSTACTKLNYTVKVAFAPNSITVPPSGPTVCATTGSDGPTNVNSSINTYFPPLGNVNLPAGSTSIALAATPPTDPYGNSFGTVPIKAGDLLLIIQMQDATINFSNSTLYGSGLANSGPDGLGGTGYTNLGNSGKYEYIIATSDVPLTGGNLTFKGSGTGEGTVYSYVNAGPTSTSGKKSFQIIRIPQYSNLRLSSNISPPPFNGIAGGIIAFQVAGNMDFNGFTIDVSARGFRGGYGPVHVSVSNYNDLYVTTSDDQRSSGKGEGVAGTPRYMWDGFNAVDNIVEGMPGGSAGRGAPADAGGGGNDSNAGGGGGGNSGYGGMGGGGYEPIGGTVPSGGRQGYYVYTSGAPDYTRLIMGGGGGGGHANDALTGVKGGVGGGIVLINAGSISGNGTIMANGGDGAPGVYGLHPDGSGGAGAGGTVLVNVANPNPAAVLTINATGGKGGNTENDPGGSGVQPHGPGGGGGGGTVMYSISSGTIHVNVNGGPSGKTNSGAGIQHFATDGMPGISQTVKVSDFPPYLQGAGTDCYPQLVTNMFVNNPGIPVPAGNNVTYVIKIVNTASGGNAGGVKADCQLSAGFTFNSATVNYTGKANGPSALTNTGTAVRPLLGDFNIPAGDTVIIDLTATAGCIASGKYNASAEGLYLDPTRDYTSPNRLITAKINAFAGENTSYQVGSGTVPGTNYNGLAPSAEDVTVLNNTVTNNTISESVSASNYCANGDPAVINGSSPSATGSFTYQWQISSDNTNFTDISGATQQNYDPPAITTTTYYRREVVSSVCPGPFYSDTLAITIQPALANNTLTAPAIATFCQSGDPSAITGSTPTGGDGTYTYQWQSSADNTNFSDIPGATSKDYDPGALNATTYYRRTVTSGACTAPLVSGIITITIQPPLANNTVTAPATTSFCANGNPGVITGSIPTGGDGSVYNYQWQSSPDNSTFTDIASATSKDYSPGSVSATTYYRRVVTSGACTTPFASNVVLITVEPAISNNLISAPATAAFCTSGDPSAISGSPPSGGSGTYSYQWQSSVDNVNFTDIGAATGQSYDPSAVTVTTYYRRLITSAPCGPDASNVITITVVSPPAVPILTATSVSVCPGSTASLSIVSPQPGITYNWYDSPTRSNLLFTGSTYVTGPVSADQTFYVEAANATCSSLSLASVQVNILAVPMPPQVQSNSVSVCTGTSAILHVSGPQPGLTYNWYASATGGSLLYSGTDFITPAIQAGTSYYVEAVNSGGCSSSPRTMVAVNAIPLPSAPTVADVSICPGSQATLTATDADPNATINWYSSASGGSVLFTGNTFVTPALNNGTTYYAEAVNVSGCIATGRTAANVSMIQPLTAPNVKVNSTTITSITFSWDAVSGATGYQVSTDNGTAFTDPSSGADGLTHTVSGLQTGQTITIMVRAYGDASCQLSENSLSVTGTAESQLGDEIFVPNAFTPNGDGKNDILYVYGTVIKSIKFYVYDQWGELIFTSNDQSYGWDGTYKGNKEPVGVYVYYVEVIADDGKKLTKKGTVTLIR